MVAVAPSRPYLDVGAVGRLAQDRIWVEAGGGPAQICVIGCWPVLSRNLGSCLTDASVLVRHMLNYPAPLDRAFQALADPTRRAMVERLTQGPASVSELKRPLAMSLPAVMQHLGVLETSGAYRFGEVGTRAHLPHQSPRAGRSRAMDHGQASGVGARLDRLGEYLDSLNAGGNAPNQGEPDDQDR